ncbi:MAG: hypothetical protein COA47_13285 [Robiginitomaculum sp.]|nr:MAG: hypothetical protein COA47_13285 [Robiginitomaculum sp.]
MTHVQPANIQLIVGTHRSGTSLLTRLVSLLGFDLGRHLMQPSFDNPRGFWENEKIVAAHDQLLSELGKDWSTAALLPENWMDTSAAKACITSLSDILIDDFQDNVPSLIKDPRLAILYPLWPKVARKLKRPLQSIAIVRSPSSVSSSVAKRNFLDKAAAAFITISYMQAMRQNLPKKVDRLIVYEHLLTKNADDILKFLSHYFPGNAAIDDPNVRNTIQGLIYQNADQNPDDPDLHQRYSAMTASTDFFLKRSSFDKMTQDFAAMLDLDASFIREHDRRSFLTKGTKKIQVEQRKFVQLNTENQELHGQIRERTEELASLNSVLVDKETYIGALDGGIVERDHLLGKLQAELIDKETRIGALNGGVIERDLKLNSLEVEHEELQRLKIAEDVKHRLDVSRNEMVERQLSQQVDGYKLLVEYYQAHPVRAAMKAVAFKGLRFMRRVTPLPDSVKSRLSDKLSGLAENLNGANNRVHQNGALTQLPAPSEVDIDFAFEQSDNPVVSIVVPVYNEISQTVACLKSIHQQKVSVEYEVILADDCSPDPFHTILGKIDGLRYFRNEENLGFLMNCNVNAAQSRGQYIVFLNNDTLVNPGWLDALVRTYQEHGDVGIVGSKLIFPNGKLQEAGGIIWEDGSGWNWGRDQSPDHPLYNFVRDVDYVSGASLMIRRDLFEEIGGFNTKLEKAYYEDTDCCFRVRQLGYRVLYQPRSSLIHIEGLSSGTDVTSGAKKYQVSNQKIFFNTWRKVLRNHHPNADRPELASDRMVRGHVLYVDATTPEPDKDSGSLDAVNTIQILIEQGYRVHFVPGTNFAHWGEATAALQRKGVECIYHPFYSNMDVFLKERGDVFDFVVLSRAEINELFLDKIRKKCPRAKIIYNTVDLHYLRMEREAEVVGNAKMKVDAAAMKKMELSFMRAADATIVLSEHEHEVLSRNKKLADKLWNIPLIRPIARRSTGFASRKDIVFIGGYNHRPNVDAVDWLVREIWPIMRQSLPGVRLRICGSHMPDRFKEYVCNDILVDGYVADLEHLLGKCRLTIAPLRYGAGLKGKIASSIGQGVPCIGTAIAFEGMAEQGLDVIKLQADTPEQFAKLAASIYDDELVWDTVSLAGVTYHNDHYAYPNVAKTYKKMLESLQ